MEVECRGLSSDPEGGEMLKTKSPAVVELKTPRLKMTRTETSIRSWVFPLVIGVFCLMQFVFPNIVSACPTCKDGLHADGTAAAYAISILFMMGMPFLIFTCWVVTIYRLRAKAASMDDLGLAQVVSSDPVGR